MVEAIIWLAYFTSLVHPREITEFFLMKGFNMINGGLSLGWIICYYIVCQIATAKVLGVIILNIHIFQLLLFIVSRNKFGLIPDGTAIFLRMGWIYYGNYCC